jgi:glutaredoxin
MPEQDQNPSFAIISKRGCHLCEQAAGVLEDLKLQYLFFHSAILYIEDDSNLFDKYCVRVPVVRIDGTDIYEAEDLARPEECRAKLEKLIVSLLSHGEPEKALKLQ